jgi:hydrogenase assembly chaperone HypC/HupF
VSDCDPHAERCITCGDVGVPMRVLRIDEDLAVCEDSGGDVRTVEIALVDPVAPGDEVLVHADVALVRLP